MNYHACIKYLTDKNTQSMQHNNKSFFDHLVGVYSLLKKVEAPEHVCYAGLMHSVYGNEIFDKPIETDRNVIKSLIGEKAELLVFEFNNTPRKKLNESENSDMQTLITFNELEQNTLFKKYDNIFTSEVVDSLYFNYRDEKEWQWIGSGMSDKNWRKFSYGLKWQDWFDRILFDKAAEILKMNKLENFLKLKRVYASASTYGCVNELHYDDAALEKNKIYTIMFYLNRQWPLSYAGETVFATKDEADIMYSILPKPGRAVFFDGSFLHAARETSRICNDLRMVVTFKYKVGK